MLYALVHSWLASLHVKLVIRQRLGERAERFYRLAYNVFAGITFLPVFAAVAWLPDRRLYQIPPGWNLLAIALQIGAVGMLALGVAQTGAGYFLGLEQIFSPRPPGTPRLVTAGLYRYVRHPLYTAGLVFIWCTPLMTVNVLAFNLAISLYLVLGAKIEERKLVKEFGQEYLDYRAKTPMLVPFLKDFSSLRSSK